MFLDKAFPSYSVCSAYRRSGHIPLLRYLVMLTQTKKNGCENVLDLYYYYYCGKWIMVIKRNTHEHVPKAFLFRSAISLLDLSMSVTVAVREDLVGQPRTGRVFLSSFSPRCQCSKDTFTKTQRRRKNMVLSTCSTIALCR